MAYRYFKVEHPNGITYDEMSPDITSVTRNEYLSYLMCQEDIIPGDDWIELTEEEYINGINTDFPQPDPDPDPEPDPEPTPQEIRDQAILDTAVDMEYLLCLQELGLLVITE